MKATYYVVDHDGRIIRASSSKLEMLLLALKLGKSYTVETSMELCAYCGRAFASDSSHRCER